MEKKHVSKRYKRPFPGKGRRKDTQNLKVKEDTYSSIPLYPIPFSQLRAEKVVNIFLKPNIIRRLTCTFMFERYQNRLCRMFI